MKEVNREKVLLSVENLEVQYTAEVRLSGQ